MTGAGGHLFRGDVFSVNRHNTAIWHPHKLPVVEEMRRLAEEGGINRLDMAVIEESRQAVRRRKGRAQGKDG